MPRLRLRLLPREIPLKTAPYLSSRVASLRGKETSLLVHLRDGWTCSKSHFLLVFSIPFSTLALRRSTRCRWLRQLPCFCAKDSTATRRSTSPKGVIVPGDAHQIARYRWEMLLFLYHTFNHLKKRPVSGTLLAVRRLAERWTS